MSDCWEGEAPAEPESRATPRQIEREIDRLIDEVGGGGGFIIGPSHSIQPDTPIENVVAVYRRIARCRGREL